MALVGSKVQVLWADGKFFIFVRGTQRVKSHHLEDIGILLYNSFLELPGSNQTFKEKHGPFQLPRARQAERKEHAT